MMSHLVQLSADVYAAILLVDEGLTHPLHCTHIIGKASSGSSMMIDPRCPDKTGNSDIGLG